MLLPFSVQLLNSLRVLNSAANPHFLTLLFGLMWHHLEYLPEILLDKVFFVTSLMLYWKSIEEKLSR